MRREKRVLTIPEAIQYQLEYYGHVVFGRDALYGLANSGRVPIVRNGTRKLLYPCSVIDRLMQGDTDTDGVE